jgi:hypothetical protein
MGVCDLVEKQIGTSAVWLGAIAVNCECRLGQNQCEERLKVCGIAKVL